MAATEAFRTLPTRYTIRSSAQRDQEPNNVARWLASAVKECGGTVEKTMTRGPVAFVTFATLIPRDDFRADLYETIGLNWNMRKAE